MIGSLDVVVSPIWRKLLSHIPRQRKKGPKTISCACVCVPLLATLVWIFAAKCNFCATPGSLDVLGGHRSTRRNHLTCHKRSSKELPLITVKTGANHFPFADFCFSAKLWLFYCCHASSNCASIVCLYGLSVFSWDLDKRLSGHEWLLCFPALKRS